MKLLVFSDSHGNTARMAQAVERERPDQILHLGDVTRDADALAAQFPRIPLVNVCGNCDGWSQVPDERLLRVEGRLILMTHGHNYRVKSGISLAAATARQAGADLLLFGHTHIPLCDRQGELWILNPGSIRDPRRPTYGILHIEEGALDCRIGLLTEEKGGTFHAAGD